MATYARALDPEIEEYFRRAERHSDRKGSVRREAFKRLLELAHENDTRGKFLLAEKARDYFPDFPEYQEEAINVLYDMCEGHNSEVRLAGYASLTAVSKSMINIDKAWAQQNADVLLQLLQSDDEDEVLAVKRALQEHIDLDPLGTIKILSSQCAFERHGLDDEELEARERIRTLILHFFDEKIRSCIARVAEKAEVEEELLVALKGAMLSCPASELELIFERIIPSLPSIVNSRGNVGSDILQTLLSRAAEHLENGDGAAAYFVLAIAAKFVSTTPSPSMQKCKPSKVPATARVAVVDPSLYIRFHESSAPFGNVSQSVRVAIVDLACKVYETAISTIGAKPAVDVTNAFLDAAPSLYKMLEMDLSESPGESEVKSKLRLVTLIQKIVNSTSDLATFSPKFRAFLPNITPKPAKAINRPRPGGDVDMPNVSTANGTTDQVQTLSRELLKKIERKPHPLVDRVQQRPSEAESSPLALALPNAPLTNPAPSSSSQLQPVPASVSSEKELMIRGRAAKRHREDETADMDVDGDVTNPGSQRNPRKRILVSPPASVADPMSNPRSSLLNRLGSGSLRSRSATPGLNGQPLKKMGTSLSEMDMGIGLLARLSNDVIHRSGNDSAVLRGGRIKRPSGFHPSPSMNAPAVKTSYTPIPTPSNESEIKIRGAASRKSEDQQRPSTLFERLNSETNVNGGASRRRRRS